MLQQKDKDLWDTLKLNWESLDHAFNITWLQFMKMVSLKEGWQRLRRCCKRYKVFINVILFLQRWNDDSDFLRWKCTNFFLQVLFNFQVLNIFLYRRTNIWQLSLLLFWLRFFMVVVFIYASKLRQISTVIEFFSKALLKTFECTPNLTFSTRKSFTKACSQWNPSFLFNASSRILFSIKN